MPGLIKIVLFACRWRYFIVTVSSLVLIMTPSPLAWRLCFVSIVSLRVLCGAFLFPTRFLFLNRQYLCMDLTISFHYILPLFACFFFYFSSEMVFKSWIRSKIPTDRVNSWKSLQGRWENVKGSTFYLLPDSILV